MEPELLLLIGACALGLAAALFAVFKSSDFLQLSLGRIRERRSGQIINQVTRVLAMAESRLYAKSRQYEALSQRLAASKLSFEELNAMKSEFLSMVARDLRSPLAAIGAYSGLFTEESATEKQKKMSAEMASSVDRIDRLVSDLTELEMIEAGRFKIERRPFNFRGLVSALMPVMGIAAAKKGVELRYDRTNSGMVVNGDSFRLSRVLRSLLNNAVKFTPPGGVVEVSARMSGRWLTVNVKDSGPGVHPGETKRIFEKFYQSKHRKDAQLTQQGWGLGLYLAHEIIMRHGGDIGVSSPGPGRGSVFWFRVPAGVSRRALPA